MENSGTGEFVDRKSRFIASVKNVTTEEEALDFLDKVKQNNRLARHNIYAYILRDKNIMRYSDDGEPSGTAGMPVLEILKNDPDTDCVAAYQDERKESKVLTFFKDTFYSLINRISDVEFYPGASDFRLMRRPMVEAVINMGEYHRFSKGLFSFVGFNTEFIPYEVQERAGGESKWSFIKLFKYAVEGIVGYTTSPLRIATFAGVASIAASLLYLIIALIVGAIAGNITSAVAIITLILLVGGLNFLFIGIAGEYLARTYMQVKDRPVYIVKEILTYEKK